MAPKTVISNPLASFVRLSNGVYLREASSPVPVSSITKENDNETSTAQRQYPSTILLFFWANATPRVLVKYVAQYAELAPSSRIIFILTSWSDIFLRALPILQRIRLMPAVKALLTPNYQAPLNGASAPSGPTHLSEDNPVFIHAFSNGGLSTLGHFLMTYRQATGGRYTLPVSSMILDSAPGHFTVSGAVKALAVSMPKNIILRAIGISIAYGILTAFWLLRRVTIQADPVAFGRKAINSSKLIMPACSIVDADSVTDTASTGGDHAEEKKDRKVLRRCYVYSDTDDLIPAQDVEGHMQESSVKEWIVVEKEFFIGSAHVGHMRADPVRYWAIVKRYLDMNCGSPKDEAKKEIKDADEEEYSDLGSVSVIEKE